MIAAQIDGRRLGRIRLQRIADASGRTLQTALGQMVEPGAEIHTDGWKAYGKLTTTGYTHRVIRADTDPEAAVGRSRRRRPLNPRGMKCIPT